MTCPRIVDALEAADNAKRPTLSCWPLRVYQFLAVSDASQRLSLSIVLTLEVIGTTDGQTVQKQRAGGVVVRNVS